MSEKEWQWARDLCQQDSLPERHESQLEEGLVTPELGQGDTVLLFSSSFLGLAIFSHTVYWFTECSPGRRDFPKVTRNGQQSWKGHGSPISSQVFSS